MRYLLAVAGGLLLVTLAARLLTSGTGGSIIAPAPPAGVFELTAAPNGGWTQIADPKSYTHEGNGRTYLGWVNSSSGAIMASSDQGPPVQVADLGSPDNHDVPAMIVREPDHRLVVAYARHASSQLRVRISTSSVDDDPHLTNGFGAEQTLASTVGGTGSFTYPSLVQLRGVAQQPIILFYRRQTTGPTTGSLAYTVSTDSGATWSAQTVIWGPNSGDRPYWRINTDWDTRIDIFTTDKAPDISTGVWHLSYDGAADTWHQSDGTDMGAPPFWTTDATLVEDDTDGALWSWGGSWDGAPAVILMQENTTSDNRVKVARWRSGAWQVDEVLSSVGGVLAGNQFGSGMAINHENPDIIYVARKIGSKFEMYRYTTANDGATWTGEALTSGSSVDHVWAEVPHLADGLGALWLSGTYTSDTNFNFGISGFRP